MHYALIQNGVVAAYPFTDTDLRRAYPNKSFNAVLDDETRAEHGSFPVVPVVPPHGKVVLSTWPELIEGVWTEVHDVQDPPLDTRKADMAATVNAIRDDHVANGFSFNGVAFQLDDARSQPRITAMGADARFAVLAGAQAGNLRWADPDHDFGWIATDNSVVPMDAPTMVAFSVAAKLWVSRHTFVANAIKQAIMAAQDHAALDAIDVNAGWPVQE